MGLFKKTKNSAQLHLEYSIILNANLINYVECRYQSEEYKKKKVDWDISETICWDDL
jgi:hypothetical protein